MDWMSLYVMVSLYGEWVEEIYESIKKMEEDKKTMEGEKKTISGRKFAMVVWFNLLPMRLPKYVSMNK